MAQAIFNAEKPNGDRKSFQITKYGVDLHIFNNDDISKMTLEYYPTQMQEEVE